MGEYGVLAEYLRNFHFITYQIKMLQKVRPKGVKFRELERAWEQDKQEWARDIRFLLLKINKAVDDAGGQLPAADSMKYRQQYRDLL